MSQDPQGPRGLPPLPQVAVRLQPDAVPADLRALPRWVGWRYGYRDGKVTKIPINGRTGRNASSTNSATWCSFEEAVAAHQKWNLSGIGIVLIGDGDLAGLDLDGCLDQSGGIAPAAAEIVSQFASYTERSPGGSGLRVFLRGRKPAGVKCKYQKLPGVKTVEVYDSARFLTVTGCAWEGAPLVVEARQGQFDTLCQRFWPKNKPPDSTSVPARTMDVSLSDQDLLEKAKAAGNGPKFTRLLNGDTSDYGGDDSSADLGYCCMLAFWTQKDPDRIDRLFRMSGLYRAKWERADYRNATIQRAIEQCREVYTPGQRRAESQGNPGLPKVLIDTDEHRVADEVIEALANDLTIFQRGSVLVRVSQPPQDAPGIARSPESRVIAVLPKPTLREKVTERCALLKMGKDGPDSAHPPGWLVPAIDARGHWPGIRPLNGISEVPVLRPDGSLWQTPGYDPVTGVMFEPAAEFAMIPENLSKQDVHLAVESLREVVCDFAFEGECHEAAWMAALLTPMARHAFSGPAPLFLIDANVPGAGKGLLAHCIGEIVLGRAMPVSTYSSDLEEMRKRITALALAGDQVVLLDNIAGEFGNAAIDAALTSTVWQDRILGRSEVVKLPLTATWFGTGNNVVVGADTPRRVIHIRLDVMEEHPENRTDFRHPNLLKWVRENRGRLVGAAQVILSAYLRAGAPPHRFKPMGSFEGWSDIVRGALVWAGLPDPCEGTRMLAERADSMRDVLSQVLDAIEAYDPHRNGLVVTEVLQTLYAPEPQRPQDAASVTLRAALEAMVGCPPGRTPTARQVGNHLKAFRKRVVASRYLDTDRSERRSGGAVWRVHGGTVGHIPI